MKNTPTELLKPLLPVLAFIGLSLTNSVVQGTMIGENRVTIESTVELSNSSTNNGLIQGIDELEQLIHLDPKAKIRQADIHQVLQQEDNGLE